MSERMVTCEVNDFVAATPALHGETMPLSRTIELSSHRLGRAAEILAAHKEKLSAKLREAMAVAHVDEADRLWAIDHGVTFSADPKLRTVLWGWAGAPLAPQHLDDLFAPHC